MASDAVSSKAGGVFHTTHWSVVVTAGTLQSPDAYHALTHLCETYWYPLYCCVRRHGHSPEEAQDLTQAFFAKILEKNQLALADPQRGRFRTFLLRSLENFLHNAHERATAEKRGGGREVVAWDAESAEERYAAEAPAQLSPAEIFERRWASTLLTKALHRVQKEFSVTGREGLFEHLEPHLWGDDTSSSYGQIAIELGMTLVAVKVTMHRLRRRYLEVLRDEVAQTLERPEEIGDELQHLRRVFAGVR